MVTLEISSTEVRLMETSGGKVVKWANHSLEPDLFEEEVISDPQALSTAIRQLMVTSGIQERNITASVSGLYSLSRIVTVPTPLGESVTERAALEAVAEVIPFSEDEMYLSWRTIGPGEGGQQVLIVGVPRDVIDNEVQALRMVGVNPRTLDLKPIALARAVNRGQALILNIEPDSFDIVIVVDGIVEVMRTTAWQQKDLSLEERSEYLVSALELTVGFYDSHHPGFPLDPATPLFITGQMSGDLALVDKLKERAGYPIEPLTPPLEYPAHLPVSQYAVNIGLALKGSASAKNVGQSGFSLPDINFLPQAYRPWRPSAKQIYFFCAIIAALVLLFPMYKLTNNEISETAKLKIKHESLNNQLNIRKAELAKRELPQQAIDDYNAIVDMGGGFIEDLEVIRNRAEELGVEVGPISHAGNQISFDCQADSHITFREYKTALEESGRFSSVTFPAEQVMYPPQYIESGSITLTPKPRQ